MARQSFVLQERIAAIQGFRKTVEHVDHLVAELDGSRAASQSAINGLCASIERELAQLRQRALSTGMGTLGDTAGAPRFGAAAGAGPPRPSQPRASGSPAPFPSTPPRRRRFRRRRSPAASFPRSPSAPRRRAVP